MEALLAVAEAQSEVDPSRVSAAAQGPVATTPDNAPYLQEYPPQSQSQPQQPAFPDSRPSPHTADLGDPTREVEQTKALSRQLPTAKKPEVPIYTVMPIQYGPYSTTSVTVSKADDGRLFALNGVYYCYCAACSRMLRLPAPPGQNLCPHFRG